MNQKIIIVGGVAAGPKAACRLKRLQPGWDVIVLDQDRLISYGGCGIPYYVCGDVYVGTEESDNQNLKSSDAASVYTLNIEAGTQIVFMQEANIAVMENGQFKAMGTVSDSIVFTAFDTSAGWLGLNFIKSGEDDTLSFCRFR